jgi:hypothetical protein
MLRAADVLWTDTRNVMQEQFSQLLPNDSKAICDVCRIKERNYFGYNINMLMHSCCFMNHQIQSYWALQWELKGKGKGKVHSTTDHEGSEGGVELKLSGFGGLVVSMLASGTQDRGFEPGHFSLNSFLH